LIDFGRSKIYIIDHNPNWKDNQRQKRESFWIRELQILQTLSFLSLIIFPIRIVVNDINFGSAKVNQ
jgi:hypothetical protein